MDKCSFVTSFKMSTEYLLMFYAYIILFGHDSI